MTQTSAFGVSKRENHDASAFYSRGLMKVVEDKKTEPATPYPSSVDALFCASSENMYQVKDNSVALTVTSPSYHVGKEYDTDDSFDDYLSLLFTVFQDVYRVTEPGGRAAINVAGLGRKPYVCLSTYVNAIMIQLGWFPRGEIVWQKGAGASGSCAWGSWRRPSNPTLRDLHEKILVYSKARFDRHPDRKQRIDTMTPEEFMEYTLSIWKFPAESAKRVGHPAPFPVELPSRLIKLYTYPGELVLDPFIGAGTTAVAAKELGRHWVGYDIDSDYLDIARRRLK